MPTSRRLLAKQLIDKVLERGGTDNVTVIVIKCREARVMSGNDRNFRQAHGPGQAIWPGDEKTVLMPPPDAVAVGTQLSGTYELDQRIAAGGMGEVFKGHNIQTGDPVAIKIVLPEFARDSVDPFAVPQGSVDPQSSLARGDRPLPRLRNRPGARPALSRDGVR